MLSIGKLSTGRASYYTAQLPGGADEYYTVGRPEAPAVWLGSAADRLGLDGGVDPDAFRRLLDAAHPASGKPLGVPRTTANCLAGYDLCFSAPKSVSALWALAPPEVSDLVAGAHDRAVAQAVGVIESEVVRARRGKRAATLVETEGIVAAAFGHRTSRGRRSAAAHPPRGPQFDRHR
jgi:conjugative relaxase-like TrwC/TraI family protein